MHSKNIIFVQICNTYWRSGGIGNLTTSAASAAVHTNITLYKAPRRRRVVVGAAHGAGALLTTWTRSPAASGSPAPHTPHALVTTHRQPGRAEPRHLPIDGAIGLQSEYVKRHGIGRANTRLSLALMGHKLACVVSGWRQIEERGRGAHPGAGVTRPPRRAYQARLARQPHGALQQAARQLGAPLGEPPLAHGVPRHTHRQSHRTGVSFLASVSLQQNKSLYIWYERAREPSSMCKFHHLLPSPLASGVARSGSKNIDFLWLCLCPESVVYKIGRCIHYVEFQKDWIIFMGCTHQSLTY